MKTQIVVIPPSIGKHVVGKKGKTITAIQKKYNVEIKTAPPREDDETLISITGPSQQNKKAEAEIIDIILNQLEGEKQTKSKREDHEGNICRFDQEGKCRYGVKCWRIHLPKHDTKDTTRTRSRSRSPAKRHHSRQRARTPPRRTEDTLRSPHRRTHSRPRTSVSPPRKYTRHQDPPQKINIQQQRHIRKQQEVQISQPPQRPRRFQTPQVRVSSRYPEMTSHTIQGHKKQSNKQSKK